LKRKTKRKLENYREGIDLFLVKWIGIVVPIHRLSLLLRSLNFCREKKKKGKEKKESSEFTPWERERERERVVLSESLCLLFVLLVCYARDKF
jgi:hypothetical protein